MVATTTVFSSARSEGISAWAGSRLVPFTTLPLPTTPQFYDKASGLDRGFGANSYGGCQNSLHLLQAQKSHA
jgi:hypothetical protein